MKRFLPLIAALTFSVFAAGQAQAGIYIEPFIGYETGETEENDDYTGVGFGARLGYQMLGLAFGAEYASSGLTIKYTDGSADQDADTTDLGLFVSYQFPILFRVFATYFLDSTAEAGAAEFTGNGGTRLGVGYTGLPFVVINFEMLNRKYDTLKFGAISSSQDSDIKGYMLSVS